MKIVYNGDDERELKELAAQFNATVKEVAHLCDELPSNLDLISRLEDLVAKQIVLVARMKRYQR